MNLEVEVIAFRAHDLRALAEAASDAANASTGKSREVLQMAAHYLANAAEEVEIAVDVLRRGGVGEQFKPSSVWKTPAGGGVQVQVWMQGEKEPRRPEDCGPAAQRAAVALMAQAQTELGAELLRLRKGVLESGTPLLSEEQIEVQLRHGSPTDRCPMVCPHGDRCRLEAGHEHGCSHTYCTCNEPNRSDK